MKDNMKVDCFYCKYGGLYIEKEDLFRCKCKWVGNKIFKHDDFFDKDEYYVKGNQDHCKYYIPHIELENDDIEKICRLDVHHKCPHCGYEDTEEDVGGEDTKLITCSNCGKQYEISWCIY